MSIKIEQPAFKAMFAYVCSGSGCSSTSFLTCSAWLNTSGKTKDVAECQEHLLWRSKLLRSAFALARWLLSAPKFYG